MSKILTVLLVIVLLVFGFVVFSNQNSDDQDVVVQPREQEQEVSSSPPVSVTPAPIEELEPQGFVQLVALSEPLSGATVTSPFMVKGTAQVSGKAKVRILNKDRKELISEMANLIESPDKKGSYVFQLKLSYEFANTKDGFLEVFVDGDVGVEVPLKFE